MPDFGTKTTLFGSSMDLSIKSLDCTTSPLPIVDKELEDVDPLMTFDEEVEEESPRGLSRSVGCWGEAGAEERGEVDFEERGELGVDEERRGGSRYSEELDELERDSEMLEMERLGWCDSKRCL